MPEARRIPEHPEQLLEALFAIFPDYCSSYIEPIHDGEPTFHSVLIGFSSFPLAGSSESQLREFGQAVVDARERGQQLIEDEHVERVFTPNVVGGAQVLCDERLVGGGESLHALLQGRVVDARRVRVALLLL